MQLAQACPTMHCIRLVISFTCMNDINYETFLEKGLYKLLEIHSTFTCRLSLHRYSKFLHICIILVSVQLAL